MRVQSACNREVLHPVARDTHVGPYRALRKTVGTAVRSLQLTSSLNATTAQVPLVVGILGYRPLETDIASGVWLIEHGRITPAGDTGGQSRRAGGLVPRGYTWSSWV